MDLLLFFLQGLFVLALLLSDGALQELGIDSPQFQYRKITCITREKTLTPRRKAARRVPALEQGQVIGEKLSRT